MTVLVYFGKKKFKHGDQQKRRSWRKMFRFSDKHKQERREAEELFGFDPALFGDSWASPDATVKDDYWGKLLPYGGKFPSYSYYEAEPEPVLTPELQQQIDDQVQSIATRLKEQGVTKILFVCSANVDRSPTAENLFDGIEGLQVDSAGVGTMPIVRLKPKMLDWADRVFVMDRSILNKVRHFHNGSDAKIVNLNIPDAYVRGSTLLKQTILAEMDKVIKA